MISPKCLTHVRPSNNQTPPVLSNLLFSNCSYSHPFWTSMITTTSSFSKISASSCFPARNLLTLWNIRRGTLPLLSAPGIGRKRDLNFRHCTTGALQALSNRLHHPSPSHLNLFSGHFYLFTLGALKVALQNSLSLDKVCSHNLWTSKQSPLSLRHWTIHVVIIFFRALDCFFWELLQNSMIGPQ